MKRVPLGDVAQPNFIGCWMLENDRLCDGLVDYFERNAEAQKPGRVAPGKIDTSAKQSLDITITPNDLKNKECEIFAEYINALNQCYFDYTEQWTYLRTLLPTVHIGPFNIRRYDVGGHFGKWHAERTALANLHRVLAWMTYLNDVEAGGETEFSHFDLKVRPVKGMHLIWPAEWTHAHRGCVLEKGVKYIITGWMLFPK